MKSKLTVDNFDHSHSVTYEKMAENKESFDIKGPSLHTFGESLIEPAMFSLLDQLWGLKKAFRSFSVFTFPKYFGRLRLLFRARRLIARICPEACLECLSDFEEDPEAPILRACFEEMREKEKLLSEIQLRIISVQKS